jgi:hypothetical protein
MRYTRRDGLLLAGAVLGVIALYGGYLWLQAQSPPRLASVDATATATARCADAVQRVQQYQPPGQRAPLQDVLTGQLVARESGGVRAEG